MTTTTDLRPADARRGTRSPSPSTVVDRFLELIETGQGAATAEVFAPGAKLDATVPGWRFHLRGPEAIAKQFSGWFGDVARFEELDRQTAGDVEFVTYLIAAENEQGVPYVAHQVHQLTVDAAGLIVSDKFFCGGRWDAALLAKMAEAEAAIDG